MEYNIFKLNEAGFIDSANRLRFDDDGKATAHARDMYHSGRVEVWAGKRKVAILPPTLQDRRNPAARRSI